MDVWLEIRTCPQNSQGKRAAIDSNELKRVPALADVFSNAEKADAETKNSRVWEYSRRLKEIEISQVMKVVAFTERIEDALSVSISTNVIYKNSCFTLTIFTAKQSQ